MQAHRFLKAREIYAVKEGQAPRKLWSAKEDIVYALAAQQMDCWRLVAIADMSFASRTMGTMRMLRISKRSRD